MGFSVYVGVIYEHHSIKEAGKGDFTLVRLRLFSWSETLNLY